ncbi:MAG TPA: CPBP family intramembrane glutamic endopeptidase [Ideonella sp.]|uniref:CPBP family intramembrane glutamic endopeptidase n=1 Tax=Ideonella sp. TaxID=1929293 RepID=UPI002B544C38|nr:CPBP family intramembrane glutamic endopeptidase [Ideonella sp.]HSI48509.1 CPBP family intramembrane glutamic endopeptidase [Ideonella sp.]
MPPPAPLEPPPERDARFPSAVGAVWLMLVLMLLQALMGEALYGASQDLGLAEPDVTALVLILSYGLLFSVLLYRKGIGYGALFHAGPSSAMATLGVTAAPLLLMTPGLVLGISTLDDILVRLVPLSSHDTELFKRMSDTSLSTVLTACLIAPVLEELLYRGVILRSFLAQYAAWPAIVGSAVLFGVAHLNIYQFMVGLLLGVLTGWLYERTRSVGPGLLLHIAYNSLITWLASDSTPPAPGSDGQIGMGWWVLSLILMGVGLRWLVRLLSPSGTARARDPGSHGPKPQ